MKLVGLAEPTGDPRCPIPVAALPSTDFPWGEDCFLGAHTQPAPADHPPDPSSTGGPSSAGSTPSSISFARISNSFARSSSSFSTLGDFGRQTIFAAPANRPTGNRGLSRAGGTITGFGTLSATVRI